MRVTHNWKALNQVTDFLNVITPELTANQWNQWCQERPNWLKDEPGQPLKISVVEARAIQGEILQDLGAVWADRGYFSETIDQDLVEKMEVSTSTILGVFCYKLNQLQMKFEWSSRQVTKGGNVIQRGGKKERWTVNAIPMIEDIRTWLYYIIAETFRMGSLSALKICSEPTCRKYFAANHQRKRFCDDPCRDDYFNRLKAQRGEFKKNRDHHRKNKLEEAKRLRDAGKSQEEVKAETKLPAREIRKLFAPRIFLGSQELLK